MNILVLQLFAQEFLITTQSQIKLTSKHYHLLFELSKINKLLNFRNEISKILLSEYEIRRFKFCKNEINYLLDVLLKTRKKSFYFKSVLVHGDFAPWNIRCLENDKLLLIDWEFCNRNGLPFYDLYYYQFIILLTLNKKVSIDENKYSRLYLNKEESSDETKLIKTLAKLKVLVDINKN